MADQVQAMQMLKNWKWDLTTGNEDKLFKVLKMDLEGAEYRITVEKTEGFDAESATIDEVKALPFVLTRKIEDQSQEIYRTHLGCCMGCMALDLTKAALRDNEGRKKPAVAQPNPKSPWAQ